MDLSFPSWWVLGFNLDAHNKIVPRIEFRDVQKLSSVKECAKDFTHDLCIYFVCFVRNSQYLHRFCTKYHGKCSKVHHNNYVIIFYHESWRKSWQYLCTAQDKTMAMEYLGVWGLGHYTSLKQTQCLLDKFSN